MNWRGDDCKHCDRLTAELTDARVAHAETQVKLEKVESIRDEYALALEARLTCTPAERKVLDEMAKLRPEDIEYLLSNDFYAPAFMDDVAAAELARRKQSHGG